MLWLLLCAFLSATLLVPATSSAAGASACQREPRDAVAQMCGDQNERMYGMFVTFVYPDVSYGGLAPTVGQADFFNETQLFTDDAMTKSFAFGLDVHYIGTETDYQPYWLDYSNGYNFQKIGGHTTSSDKRNHTFLALPACGNCATWDIYYDFVKVGTTGQQPGPMSFHLLTGWDLTDIPGDVAISATSNRVRFLDGNNQFRQFAPADTSVRVPQGSCGHGADPLYCWQWNTAVTSKDGRVVSWDTAKPIVRPSSARASAAGPVVSDDREIEALVARAQKLADQHAARG